MTEIDCHYLRDGRCLLAEGLTGLKKVPVCQDRCVRCVNHPKSPKSPNGIIAAIALCAVPKDSEERDRVLEIVKPYIERTYVDPLTGKPTERRDPIISASSLTEGVGTELHYLIDMIDRFAEWLGFRLGFKVTSKCKCKQHMMEMNLRGPDWCESHVDLIVGWLETESHRLKLGWDPVRNAGCHRLVHWAIARDRKKKKRKEKQMKKKDEPVHCIYLKDELAQEHRGQKIHLCQQHERCVTGKGFTDMPGCKRCKQKLLPNDPEFVNKWEDPLEILDRKRNRTHALRNLLSGGTAFLLCGGPSANDLALEKLSQRGIWSLAVNNMAAHPRIRPQAFICADPPMKFSHSIWLDPGIMKFIPNPKFTGSRNKLRRKVDGKFLDLDVRTPDAPNTWGFKRRGWMALDETFFTEDSAPWGNMNEGVIRTGLKKTGCTMLCAIRLLRYLGAHRVFLVGVDFDMGEGRGYSFGQKRTESNARSNNSQYEIVNEWLVALHNNKIFERFGMEIYNCYQYSGLRAFPYVPFDQAVEAAIGMVEQEPDTSHWYEKESFDPEQVKEDQDDESL